MISTLGFLFAIISIGYCVQIDNAVTGLPEVDCMDEMVKMKFHTERPFTGRIFVKGMADKQTCVTSYKTNSANSIEYQLKNGQCNMRRQRRLGPQKGIEQSMTVIISFHDTFITKVDRAYRCTCFFMEADKIVTSALEVSMLPTVDLIDTARMPLCTYNVRSGSVDGPLITHAKIGEKAFHVWQCDSGMFGMLVHSCAVDDGSGQGRFQLLDNHGCAVDPVILTDLQYKPEANEAFVEAPVFKFADKTTVYFQCSISLCMKNDGACLHVTPPVCNRTRAARAKRSSLSKTMLYPNSTAKAGRHHMVGIADMDVAPGLITVLDIDEDANRQQFDSLADRSQNYYETDRSSLRQYHSDSEEIGEVCIQTTAFIAGLVATLLLTLVTASFAFIFYIRRITKLHNSASAKL